MRNKERIDKLHDIGMCPLTRELECNVILLSTIVWLVSYNGLRVVLKICTNTIILSINSSLFFEAKNSSS